MIENLKANNLCAKITEQVGFFYRWKPKDKLIYVWTWPSGKEKNREFKEKNILGLCSSNKVSKQSLL